LQLLWVNAAPSTMVELMRTSVPGTHTRYRCQYVNENDKTACYEPAGSLVSRTAAALAKAARRARGATIDAKDFMMERLFAENLEMASWCCGC
jgi:hypothetical protein